MWPLCEHGYNITPSHKCPWCFDGDTSKYKPVVGKGNGWLLHAEGSLSIPCEGCGGPAGAGWGAWAGPENPTPEQVYDATKTIMYCYHCTSEGKRMKRTSKMGAQLTADEQRRINIGECPDCGKRFFKQPTVDAETTCPRLTCGSKFKDYVRASDAHPDEPPKKYVDINKL